MATIVIEGGHLNIEMSLLDRVLSLKSHLTIPLQHVTGVTIRPEEARSWVHGFKVGTNVPGAFTAGTFYTGDGKVFYDMRDADQTIAIELQGESYIRVIVQVDDPEGTAERIRRALVRRPD
jgi:hypothetical protein